MKKYLMLIHLDARGVPPENVVDLTECCINSFKDFRSIFGPNFECVVMPVQGVGSMSVTEIEVEEANV